MMNSIKNKIQSTTLSVSDLNMSLGTVTKYCWMAAGIFFITYLYLVGSITFAVIKQESLSQRIRTIVSQTSKEEQKYLNLQMNLTEGYAEAKGFISAQAAQVVTYATPSRNFAWNNQ